MEPNKIEKQFRDKLNSREIQPSAQAWDRLDAMLSVAEEKKTKRSFGWLYIAASITVLATVGMFLFNQKDTVNNYQNTVVGTETKQDTVQKPSNEIVAPVIQKEIQNSTVASSSAIEPTKERQPTVNTTQRVSINNQSNNNQNQNIRDKQIEFQNSSDVAQKDLPKIMEPKPVIIKKETTTKSDENLLADLDKTAQQSSNTKASVKVDAKKLLSEVDGEVEHSFREKMFTKINKNYQEIKVALANRNNE